MTNVERSKAFDVDVDVIGFRLDHDVQPGNGMRVIQLTPPGSACSIVIGEGMGNNIPEDGTAKGLHLVVKDIDAVIDALVSRGADVSGTNDMGGVKFAYFSDPDGNTWALQQMDVSAPA